MLLSPSQISSIGWPSLSCGSSVLIISTPSLVGLLYLIPRPSKTCVPPESTSESLSHKGVHSIQLVVPVPNSGQILEHFDERVHRLVGSEHIASRKTVGESAHGCCPHRFSLLWLRKHTPRGYRLLVWYCCARVLDTYANI